MSHFAEIDENNIVLRVLVIEQDVIDSGLVGNPSKWIQTSYNTKEGVHLDPYTNQPDGGVALRKNYAGKGFTYDATRDTFIPPKPYASWTLNEDTCDWDAPVPYPDDGLPYYWDESEQTWKE
tara:strand:- start:226 stop:591 length:366 start_codon:yes stop_codon:yes gene_type:complete